MAHPKLMHEEQHLLAELPRGLAALRQTAGVEGRLVETGAGAADQTDALVEFHVDGRAYRYAVEAKARIDRYAALNQLKERLARKGTPCLLFVPHMTIALARHCREMDMAFLDLAGNAYLRQPGLYVCVNGEKPDPATTTIGKRGRGTATALRVTFALLCNHTLLNATYRDIEAAADVAIGAIKGVFVDLEERGYIAGAQRKRNHRLLEPARLFEEWVTNYPITLRPKLNPRRFRAEDPEWWKKADLNGLGAYWGGEIAADRLTNYLKPTTCTIYIEPDTRHGQALQALTKLVVANRLRADPKGNIEILDAFWHLPPAPDHGDCVPPILTYADLMATHDPRHLEVAKLIRGQYIEHGFNQA